MKLPLRAANRAVTVLPPQATRVLWLSDSIFNMGTLWDAVSTALTNTVPTVAYTTATYGGNTFGNSLMHLADETQAYVSGAWAIQPRPVPFSSFSAVIIESGRNDSNASENTAAYSDAWDKAIAQAIKYFPRVVVSNCPRVALANLSDWDSSANDNMLFKSYKSLIDAVWAKWGVPTYDTFQNFQDLVTATTYTVAQLMRDTNHPTTSTGAAVIAAAIAAKLNTYVAPAALQTPAVTGRVVNYLFGQPTVGSWVMASAVSSVGPNNSPVPTITTLADQVPVVSASGAKVTFPATQATQIWLHYLLKTGGGTATAYVDRGTGQEKQSSFDSADASQNNYPRNLLLGGSSLAAGLHTVEVETTSANPVAILGITVVGAT